MERNLCVHIYFKRDSKAIGKKGLARIFDNSLRAQILKEAEKFGMQQVVCIVPTAGFMAYSKLVFNDQETFPGDLPICIELIDSQKRIITFVNQNTKFLKDCRIIYYHQNENSELNFL